MHRATALVLLAAFVAACGGDSASIMLPTKIGARVVYVADSDGSGYDPGSGPYSDEIWVADTGSASMEVMEISNNTVGRAIGWPLVAPGGDYLGAFVGSISNHEDACPGGYQLFHLDTDTASRFQFFDLPACAPELKFSPDGDTTAVRFKVDVNSSWDLAFGSAPGFESTIHGVGHPRTNFPRGSFSFSGNGSTLVWVENGGLYSINAMTAGGSASLRSLDTPYGMQVTPDGTKVVYSVTSGVIRVTNAQPNSTPSFTDITAPLASGGSGSLALSPDGSRLLYVTGDQTTWELWLVNISTPGSAQRIDAAAPLYKSAWYDPAVLAWNTDGTRFAWLGRVGTGTPQIYYADVATPTTATPLTPASEGTPASVLWTDASTVVYRNSFAAYTYELRSVATTAPLATVLISPTGIPMSGVIKVLPCADGKVAYLVRDDTNSWFEDVNDSTRLFSAQPMVAGYLQITPRILAGPDRVISGISDFACEP